MGREWASLSAELGASFNLINGLSGSSLGITSIKFNGPEGANTDIVNSLDNLNKLASNNTKYTMIDISAGGKANIIAYARVTITSGVLSIDQSGGFASIVRTSAGKYTCTFSSAQPNDDYTVLLTRTHHHPLEGSIVVDSQTETSFKIISSNDNSSFADPKGFNVMVLNDA